MTCTLLLQPLLVDLRLSKGDSGSSTKRTLFPKDLLLMEVVLSAGIAARRRLANGVYSGVAGVVGMARARARAARFDGECRYPGIGGIGVACCRLGIGASSLTLRVASRSKPSPSSKLLSSSSNIGPLMVVIVGPGAP